MKEHDVAREKREEHMRRFKLAALTLAKSGANVTDITFLLIPSIDEEGANYCYGFIEGACEMAAFDAKEGYWDDKG